MNNERSKTSDAHRLRLNFTDKTDLRNDDMLWHYQTLVSTAHGRI